MLAPKRTPAPRVARLRGAGSMIASAPDLQAEWARQGETALVMTPQAFDKYLQDDIAKWTRVIHSANIKPE